MQDESSRPLTSSIPFFILFAWLNTEHRCHRRHHDLLPIYNTHTYALKIPYWAGSITLCGRSDGAPGRAFTGSIAQLMLWQDALTSQDVANIWKAAGTAAAQRQRRGGGAGSGDGAAFVAGEQGDEEEEDDTFGPLPVGGDARAAGTAADALSDQRVAAGHVLGASEGELCTLDTALDRNVTFCSPGLVCAPLHRNEQRSRRRRTDSPEEDATADSSASAVEESSSRRREYLIAATGTCATMPLGGLLPHTFPPSWPTPLAFFPLTAGSLDAWPDPARRFAGGAAAGGAAWHSDGRFGSVLACDRDRSSYVELPAVPYAADGPFAVNLWVKLPRPPAGDVAAGGSISRRGGGGGATSAAAAEDDNEGFEYILSHSGPADATNDDDNDDIDSERRSVDFGPNQVHLYVPRHRSPVAGIVRAIVKDGNDRFLGRRSEVSEKGTRRAVALWCGAAGVMPL